MTEFEALEKIELKCSYKFQMKIYCEFCKKQITLGEFQHHENDCPINVIYNKIKE